jgi:ATP-binding cassette subfamily B protein
LSSFGQDLASKLIQHWRREAVAADGRGAIGWRPRPVRRQGAAAFRKALHMLARTPLLDASAQVPSAPRAGRAGRGRAATEEESTPVRDLARDPWAFLWRFVSRDFLGRYAAMTLAVVLAQGFETLQPYALKRLVNALAGASAAPAADAGFWFLLLMALWFASVLLFRLYEAIDIYAAPYLRERVQNALFGYLLGHSPRYFQETFAGKLGQQIKEAGRTCLGLLSLITFDLGKLAVMLAVAMALLAAENAALAGLLALWAAVYVGASAGLARRCIRLSKSFSDAVSTSAGKLIDSIANADTVRSFANWRHERAVLGGFLGEERRRSVRLRWFLTLIKIFQAVAVLAMLGGLVLFSLGETLAGRMDIGAFVLVFTLTGMIGLNVWNLSSRMIDFFEVTGTLSEAIQLVTRPHEIVDRAGARPLRVTGGAISFRGVAYRHPDGLPLFDGFDLDIAAGEKVALVGPSGSGKSTLVKLLRRHFEPHAGRILIDGRDIAEATWDSVNEAIAEVPQSPGIFHRPVGDNIRYGRLAAGDSEVAAAAKRAHCHEFIAGRPKGYGTIVGEQGIKLSGGERQRVAIARALLKDAPILVLDEATSSLDSESEHYIQEALWELMRGRTVIAVAHRLSTIRRMDRILCLRQGRIVEQGSHQELVAKGGAYARLWARQAGGFIAEEKADGEMGPPPLAMTAAPAV